MKLYYLPGACSLADHIVLEWIGAPYETVRLDHAGTKSAEYLALNPNGTVPLLVDDDFVLSQNAAILFYLAERYPDARLLGNGTLRGKAEVLRWVCFLNSDVHPAFKPLFRASHFHPDASAASDARQHVRDHVQRLDARLQSRDWLVDQKSIADPYLFVLLRWALRFKIDLGEFNHLASFFERMYAEPAVRGAILAEEGSL